MAIYQTGQHGEVVFSDHCDSFLVSSTSTVVMSGLGRFFGMYVSSAGQGANAMSIYDGSSSNGRVLMQSIPLTAGTAHSLPCPVRLTTGLFAAVEGVSKTAVSVTLLYLRDRNP